MGLQVLRQAAAGLRVLVVLSLLTGALYPVAVWGIAQLAFEHGADGSRVGDRGRTVGSSLIGQDFSGPRWFHSRPSAAGPRGYDPLASGASDLGPENGTLLRQVRQRRAAAAAEDGVAPGRVPPDALTASGSGLDPHVSPGYARRQSARVARARGLPERRVAALVGDHVRGRLLGFLGAPRVNVLELNLALERLGRRGPGP
ncbi:potassium-transporting ATPase KdpC subunit [Streptomyces sulfonofaciens]|uniref:Potassium-transporting ATPase KdpC subunit n=1 Tax=Streptomyces sulfonofaciens TaxID=68272 RepID=A0A919FVE7_9ACTN|nr:potassium-transporting ATPase subunit KdpC [Streptomyces sulfonofaciens]GHH72644.1 potassium-transporting ATPase KdpC subunit [Streptomyces sulfonofaciens]